jgi:hypothetical protein
VAEAELWDLLMPQEAVHMLEVSMEERKRMALEGRTVSRLCY